MSIPYRTQQKLKRIAVALLILLVVIAIGLGMWVIWLQRFVVYTRDTGAVIDFEKSEILPTGELAVPPEEEMAVEIYYNEGDNKINVGLELTQLNGYYVTGEELLADPAGVWEQIQALPTGTAVMLDVKDIYGDFYYSTTTGRPKSSDGNIAGVDALLQNLKRSNYYTIARLPALRDRAFGLDHPTNGMPIEGGYLWIDEQGCYWLDPTKEGTVTYLINVIKELQSLGFNEVVLEEYYFPDTDDIVFTSDKQQALADTAKALINNCTDNTFAVSFVTDGSWTMPDGRTRVYRDDVNNPVELLTTVENLTIENPAINLVFITNNTDPRFEEYSVLRPLNQAR